MGDRNGNEVLQDMVTTPPGLAKSQEEVWRGGLSLDECVVLQGGAEMLVVAEDAAGILLGDRKGLLARGRGSGAVYHGATQRRDVHITVDNLQDDAVLHGGKYVASESLLVVVREHDGMHRGLAGGHCSGGIS